MATTDQTFYIVQQAPTAPPLQSYRVSFWAYVGRAETLAVNYQPAPGQVVGDPFLRFVIPRNGLVAGANGVPLKRGDSVEITVRIDSAQFAVHFDPSGVLFSMIFPANLTLWYENVDPDLNGDGVVNGLDRKLRQQLAFYYHGTKWQRLSSNNDPTQQSVTTLLYHFSDYAMSW